MIRDPYLVEQAVQLADYRVDLLSQVTGVHLAGGPRLGSAILQWASIDIAMSDSGERSSSEGANSWWRDINNEQGECWLRRGVSLTEDDVQTGCSSCYSLLSWTLLFTRWFLSAHPQAIALSCSDASQEGGKKTADDDENVRNGVERARDKSRSIVLFASERARGGNR